MAEKFRMIVARGIGNRWSVLSAGEQPEDSDFIPSAWEEINSILDDCDFEDAIGKGNDLLPHNLGVYLFDCEFYLERSLTPIDDPSSELYIKLISVEPLLTKDKDLFHNGFAHVSIDPHKCPISTHQEIMERARNVPAEDVAKTILENLNLTTEQISELSEEHAQTIKTILELYEIPFNKLLDIFKKPKVNGTIPLMDPPPNKYPNKADGEWIEHKTEENYITTIGYGNRTPEQVIAILKENNIQLIFDVRRIGSKGRLRVYDHGKNFRTFLADHGIEYGQIQNPACCIGNQYDSLDEYKQNIKTGMMEWIADKLIKTKLTTCFLCCELHAYIIDDDDNHDEPNCHRVHVADAVAEELRKLTGEPWGIEHL